MRLIQNILNIGIHQQAFANANRTRTLNFISLFSTLISALYTLNYFFFIQHTIVALINTVFTFAYLSTIFFHRNQAFIEGKIWFFSVLMLHLFVCTNIYVTNASGFHLYYFLVPTGAFLLFELNEKLEKISLSAISVALFFYCENTINPSPLITLSPQMNHMIYQSVVLINMLEVIIVLTIFANQIEKNEKKLIQQATTDSLTGIANRHNFFEQGQALMLQAKSTYRPLCVCLLDFDLFKRINDQYGHSVGDKCLIEMSGLIQKLCRTDDLFARIGGEEFAIILPNTLVTEAREQLECIRAAIAEHEFLTDDKKGLQCTASFGLASKESQNIELKTLLIHADKALYKAKSLGRNQLHYYSANE